MEARCSLARSRSAEMLVDFTSGNPSEHAADADSGDDAAEEERTSSPRGGVRGAATPPGSGRAAAEEEKEAADGLMAMTGDRRGGGRERGRGGEMVEAGEDRPTAKRESQKWLSGSQIRSVLQLV